MKKIILILTVVLIAIIAYAYDPSIETTATEKEKNILKDLEQEHIDSELKIYRKSVEQKKAKGETIDKTEQEVIDNAKANFNYKVKKTAEIIKKSTDDINFFGRVVDQSTNPIPNAIVPFKLSHYNIFTNLKKTKYKCYTDENGCFEITDARGLSLWFDKPIKEGYEFTKDCRANTLYNYDSRPHHQPDPNNPVLFIMRKIPKKAVIFRGGGWARIKKFKIPVHSHLWGTLWEDKWCKEKGYFRENSPKFKFTAFPTSDTNVYKITFELVPNGELALPDEKTQRKIDDYEWGLMRQCEARDELTPEAPTSDYLRKISIIFTNQTKNSFTVTERKKLPHGIYFFKVPATSNIILYGKIIFRITNDAYEPCPYVMITHDTYLNVEGTRNLLYDHNLEFFEQDRIEKGETKALELLEVRKNRSRKEKQKKKVLKEYKLYK